MSGHGGESWTLRSNLTLIEDREPSFQWSLLLAQLPKIILHIVKYFTTNTFGLVLQICPPHLSSPPPPSRAALGSAACFKLPRRPTTHRPTLLNLGKTPPRNKIATPPKRSTQQAWLSDAIKGGSCRPSRQKTVDFLLQRKEALRMRPVELSLRVSEAYLRVIFFCSKIPLFGCAGNHDETLR